MHEHDCSTDRVLGGFVMEIGKSLVVFTMRHNCAGVAVGAIAGGLCGIQSSLDVEI